MSSTSDLTTGLERWLTEQWGEPATVDGLSASSAGARRSNILFEAHAGDRHERLVATIMPPNLQPILGVRAETAIRSLAERHGVPTPTIRGVCLDPAYVGGLFFLSDRVDGETIPRQVLRLIERVGNGDQVAHQLGHALAKLHQVPAQDAADAMGQPMVETPVRTALDGLRLAVGTLLLQPEPAMAYGLRWLEDNLPDELSTGCTLVHTDTRNGNLIIGEDGLRGILDWEGAHMGDPMEDAAWPCVRMWRFGNNDKIVGGFASMEPYRAGYEEAGGTWNADRVRWWRVCSTLRWGLGLSGQSATHLDGTLRNIVMAASGRRVPEMEYDFLLLTAPD